MRKVNKNIGKYISRIRTLQREAMLRDRVYAEKSLKRILKGKSRGGCSQTITQQLGRLEEVLQESVKRRSLRYFNKPEIRYPENLPILSKKDDIISAIRANQVVIISGETGSGKSTQIPKMCLEAGRGISGMIGCTQPRRIAATTIAYRIAEELGEELGRSVGYKIRFSDRTPRDAYIKIMTDGMLLAETQGDASFYEYDTLIIDEAHERSVNIDFLLGLVKRLLASRPELKVIISSATLEIEKFSSFFDNAPVIEVSGKVFPVEVRYRPFDPELDGGEDITHVDAALDAVEEIRREDATGDILVFMPAEQDIIETCERLRGRLDDKQNILPLFARLSGHRQRKVYTVRGPKVVVATNVAETSLTIPGIRYVVDTGVARISRYVARTRTTSLPISPISQASAEQRKGRCGRVQRGVCIRLYSEEDYERRSIYTVPEILRANLAEVILRMTYLGLGELESFPFVDKPNARSVKDGLDLLMELGAIERKSGEVRLTKRGREMARMPLDPRVSRMLLEARGMECIAEIAVIGAALSIQDPRERPVEKVNLADQARVFFQDENSDFLTLLNIWKAYKTITTNNLKRRFCKEYFLSYPRMREWEDVHNQILTIFKEYSSRTYEKHRERSGLPLYERIHKCILSGFLSNIAVKKNGGIYQGAKGKELMIFPGSSLFKKGPEWIVAAEMVKTSRLFARTVARVEPGWIEEVGGDLCKRTYSNPRWSRASGKVVASEQVGVFGLIVSKGRAVPYGPLNPHEAHEIFVREALVQGNIRERFGFLEHNAELIDSLSLLEHKLRRKGIVADEERIKDFYSERLPGVYDLAGLRRRIKEAGSDDFLRMSKEDLLVEEPEEELLTRFPDSLEVGDRRFRLSYRFCPGKEEDGITVLVPSYLTSELQPMGLDWIVPGLLKEKIRELIKALPKEYRRKLIPVPQTAEAIAKELEQKRGPLASALSEAIQKKFDVFIPPKIWFSLKIPDHLKLRIRVMDPKGKEIMSGRDPIVLRKIESLSKMHAEDTQAWKLARRQWERTGLKKWDFEQLPEKVHVDEGTVAYPALEAGQECVNIRLYASSKEAMAKHLEGVRVLSCLELAKELKFIKRSLKLPGEVKQAAIYFGGAQAVEESLFEHLTRALFGRDVRTGEAYYEQLMAGKNALQPLARELLEACVVVINQYAEARQTLRSIANSNSQNMDLLKILKEIESDLQTLVPKEFLKEYDLDTLKELPRYLRAATVRAQRATYDPVKDRRKRIQLEEPLGLLREMQAEIASGASEEKRRAVDGYRWMVEEFKVSLFAQELGTSYPISLNRLRKKKQEIDSMI